MSLWINRHSFGEQFSQKKWTREVAGQREILAAYGGVKLGDVRGMRAPFLSIGGNKMFKMLYDSNFTYDSSMPVYENRPPSWPYTLDYKIFHDCMIPPCPTRSYPGIQWSMRHCSWMLISNCSCISRCVASANGYVAGLERRQMFDGWCLLQSTRIRRRYENVDEKFRPSLQHK